MNSITKLRRGIVAMAAASALALLAGCASSSTTSGGLSDADKYGTKDHPITLTMWSWGGSDVKPIEAAYHKIHPYVTLKITQFGGSADVYTKLGVALKAGKGAPDLTSMELMNMPSFAAQGYLLDLSKYGGEVKDFNASAAAAASFNGSLYAIPTDTGPLVMYYNATLFQQLGIDVPTTWDEYKSAAEKLKAAGHNIGDIDPGDPSLLMGLLQQAKAQPFDLTGKDKLTVQFTDKGTTQVADYWSGMLKDGYVQTEPAWSQSWFTHYADGTYATWLTGAWGASVFSGSIPQAAGQWRVAALPNWSSDSPSDGVWGGSSTAVTTQSKHPAAATALANWYSVDQYLAQLDNAANMPFPASQKVLSNSKYVDATSSFLGGQKPNQLYIEVAKTVNGDWQFLPFQLYANTVYADTVGQEVSGGKDIIAGLKAWQAKIVAYGKQQGFTVTSK
jgi:multiple sugar transport system substrate-binding protein